jgi:tetratricopeptide (TPR) repeat protein
VSEKPGDRIGHYKLLQQIGEGGCGVVYMAQQEEPVRRQVALKIIKLGMDTRNVIARFEAERQALALMDHPNIAKVFDAGATDTGRPYFVMELVRGTKITDYSDENQLPTRDRLELFVQVCDAIQHAHQKGLIHRDIKPSNILVTLRDGVPVPKVIDFGIAKATTDQLLTDKTVFTEFQQFVGTPAYMSPEQAEMSELGVDTRSDIYSLGILLYELLTGKMPFEAKRLVGAGLDEIRRIIREEEPPRPSTRLDTLDKAEQTTVAKDRRSEPPKLVGLIRGDLDWIVMKALEKDRARRYGTANGLAADIQRHLSNEPVVAGPPSNLYRFQKFVRRNKLAFAAAASIAAALLIGLGLSTWLFFKEKVARQQAQTAANRSQQVADLLKRMLERVGPSKALGRDTTMLREILDETAMSMSRDLTDQPEVEVELRLVLATTYHDLGLYKEMEEVARRSLQLARARFGEENLNVAKSLKDVGDALMHLNSDRLDQRQIDGLREAEEYSRDSLAICRKLLGNPNSELADTLTHLSNVLTAEGKLSEAERMQREAIGMYRKLFGTDDRPEIAKLLQDLGITLAPQASRVAEAETLVRQALTLQRKLLGEDHPEVAKSLETLSYLLSSQGKSAEAEPIIRKALATWRKLNVGDRNEVAGCLQNLAAVLMDEDKLPEAEIRLREAVEMLTRLSGNEAPEVINLLMHLEELLGWQGKWGEVEVVEREELEYLRKRDGNKSGSVANSLRNLANTLHRQGRLTEAETICREALASSRNLTGDDEFLVGLSLEKLASVLEEQGKLEDAVAGRREALSVLKRNLGEESSQLTDSATRLAEVLAKLTFKLGHEGRFAEAEALNKECFAEIQGKNSPVSWSASGMQSDLGASLLAQGKLAEAEPLLLAGYEGFKRCEYQIPTNAVPRLGEAAGRLARLYELSGRVEKAAEWRKEQALAQENAPVAEEAAVRRASGSAHAQQGRIAKATADFARVLELRPGDDEVWLWQAAALVRSGQLEAYRELRRNAVRQFEHTTDPITAERIAQAYLILPSAETGLQTAAKMAEAAATTTTNHPCMTWFRLTAGLAEYRRGHFSTAVVWVQQVLSESRNPVLSPGWSESEVDFRDAQALLAQLRRMHPLDIAAVDFNRDAEALLVLAMAQYQLKPTAPARATLARAVQIVDVIMSRLDSGSLGSGWVDRVIAHALMREAKGLIAGSASATNFP